jgi:hypothetical protein
MMASVFLSALKSNKLILMCSTCTVALGLSIQLSKGFSVSPQLTLLNPQIGTINLLLKLIFRPKFLPLPPPKLSLFLITLPWLKLNFQSLDCLSEARMVSAELRPKSQKTMKKALPAESTSKIQHPYHKIHYFQFQAY